MKVQTNRREEFKEVKKITIETSEDIRFHIKFDEARKTLEITKYSFPDTAIRITPNVSNQIHIE